jgi:hypothetical protein
LLDSRGRIKERGERSIILSVKAHGTGRNGLQYLFSDQCIASPMSTPTGWEQTVARLHRPGQKAKTVRTWVYVHTAELRSFFEDAILCTTYVERSLGMPQKLRLGLRLCDLYFFK